MSNILTNNINPRSGNLITIGGANDRVSIAGTLSYEDVTNIDSVGIITARDGLDTPTTLVLRTGGTEKVRVTSAGKVGIGTESPSVKLEAVDSVNNVTAKIENTDATNGYGLWVKGGGSASGRYIAKFTDAANNDRMRIDSSGNIGIGRDNPGEKLDIVSTSGNCLIKMQAPVGSVSGFSAIGSNILTFQTGFTERMQIDSSGRILTAGAATVPLTSAGGIDVCSGLYSIVIGGNSGGGSNQNQRTDTGNKEGRIVSAHKTNAEEPVSVATIFNLSTQNLLYFGGGSSLVNAATDIAFYTAANTTTTGGTERMRISSDGTVTKPTQPGFYARRSINGDGRAAGAQEWSVSGTGSYNRGNHFNASNGRFTAPVDGVYFFSAAPGYKQTGFEFSFNYRVNGVNIAEPVRFIDGGDDLLSHSLATGTIAVNLTANEYVDVYVGTTHHVNTTLNFFCGYLLG